MAMSVQPNEQSLWDCVLEMTKAAQEKNSDPIVWAVQLTSTLNSAGVPLPSTHLAYVLISHICWDNHVPIAWKFLEKALHVGIVPPCLVLALLSSRVIPNRQLHPAAYRLYMELLKQHAFSFLSLVNGSNYSKIMKSIDEVLHLSQIFGLKVGESGILVAYVFSVVLQLLDASLDDESLLEIAPEKNFRWPTKPQDTKMDCLDIFNVKRTEHHEGLCKANTTMAIELVGEFLQNKVTSKILYLACQNMPLHWEGFVQQLKFLVMKSTALRNSKHITPDALLQLMSGMHSVLSGECKRTSKEVHAIINTSSLISSSGQSNVTTQSALWLPIDLFLEDAINGSQVAAYSSIEILTGLVKALQAFNGTSWLDTFLGLWIAALRLVQRERDPSEGPVPRLDSCLSMLLSITTLAVADIIEEDESELIEETERSPSSHGQEKHAPGDRRKDLIASLQLLGDYEYLLTPPQSVRSIANQAAAKAIMFVSGVTVGNGYYYESVSMNDLPINCRICSILLHISGQLM